MKAIVKNLRPALILMVLLFTVMIVSSCSPRHSRCMSYYYDDVRRGLAH